MEKEFWVGSPGLSGGRLEVDFQQDLYFLLRRLLESRPEFAGFKFSKVRMEHKVDGGKADIVLFDETDKPFIVIETKRKNGRISKNIDPLNFGVIQQAIGYASLLGAPFFATANRGFLASFIRPERREPFSIERHRVFITQIQLLNEEFVVQFLETIIKYQRAVTLEEKAKLATGLDWTFVLRLRSFVSWLATEVEPAIALALDADRELQRRISDFAREKGTTLNSRLLSRQMSYILTNKILFYKVLERHHTGLPKLLSIRAIEPESFLRDLYKLFEVAVQTTKDFEAVFNTGIFDEIVLPKESVTLLDVFDGLKMFIKDMETYPLEKLDADVIGHVYEELLPPDERHALGQFYTPPAIAEMICDWAIRSSEDKVLDPAVGSGTFIVKAYQRLRHLKTQRDPDTPLDRIHAENIKQLFMIDINPFPAQLAAMNLAMRNVNHPVSDINVLREDFFKTGPDQVALSPYAVRTPRGEEYREIRIPKVEAVVGNPPYTRWTELPKSTRDTILSAIGSDLTEFKMKPGSVRSEPMIYLHFLIHGDHFLTSSGRLSMIVSNSWLQTDYGINFGRFLLNHFRIVGVIDFSSRVFSIPLVSTLVLLLEKEGDPRRRDQNQSSFVFVQKREQLEPTKILRAIEKPQEFRDQFWTNSFPQQALRSKSKWLNVLFGAESVLQQVRSASRVVSAEQLFNVATSNTGWAYWALQHGSRTNIGTKQFFYVTQRNVGVKGLRGYVKPALTSARHSRFYTFSKDDWKSIAKNDLPAYFFMCHEPKKEVPKSVKDYIRWGETECRTGIRKTRGGGKICSQAYTCQEREKTRERFFGWYDLGGSRYTPIMAVYQSQYRTRFFWCKENLVSYHAIVTFQPKKPLKEIELKAILAFLNSSLSHLYVEAEGRATALGLIALEVAQAERMPVPKVSELSNSELEGLASAFDSLESAARRLGGAHTHENLEKLMPQFELLDDKVAEVFGFPKELGKQASTLAANLMERRLTRTEEAIPEMLRGEEEGTLEMRPPGRRMRLEEGEASRAQTTKLDEWA